MQCRCRCRCRGADAEISKSSFICLEKGHLAKQCSKNYLCNKCKGKHNITICTFDKKDENVSNEKNEIIESTPVLSNFNKKNNVLLQTAFVDVSDYSMKNREKTHILFDSGSQRTYINYKLRNRLKLPTTLSVKKKSAKSD